MRIAVLVDGARIRGNERQVLLLTEGLVARGHTVLASCRRGEVMEAMAAAGAAVSPVRPRGDVDLVSALRFAYWLRAGQVDSILVTSWKRSAMAGWAARLAGVPRVVLRVGGLGRRGHGIGGWIRRKAIPRYYDLVISNASMLVDELVAEFPGLHRENTRLVPNGLRVEPQPPTALRAELGIAPDAPVVLGVGGLEARKGFQHLVTALPSLPGVHAVIAGTGPAHRKAALLDLAANLGVGDRFHLLGHRTDIPGLLEAADAFALPSQDDTMPNALLEAMAVGCPAVMTEVGGVREMLGPRGHRPAAGWVVPVDDGDALTAAIAEIIDLVRRGHPGVTERTHEARWRMRHWYGADQMVARYEALLAGRGEEAHS